MHAISTRTSTCRRSGLRAALAELGALSPSGLLLESRGAAGALGALTDEVRQTGCPVLGVLGPLVASAEDHALVATLDDPDTNTAAIAWTLLCDTLPVMSKLDCRRLLIRLNRGGAPGSSSDREAWRQESRKAREQAVVRVCRSLHALARREGQVELLLVPSADPFGLLDVETAEWILNDLAGLKIGLALDTGSLGLLEVRGGPSARTWFGTLARRVGLLLLSDHDGQRRDDLLLGMGRVDLGSLRDMGSRSLRRVLRPDPELPVALIEEADRLTIHHMGSAPDLLDHP